MTVEHDKVPSYLLVICTRNLRETGDRDHPMTTTLRSEGKFVFQCDDSSQAARLKMGLEDALQRHVESAPAGLAVAVSQPLFANELGQHRVYCQADDDTSPEQYYLKLLRFVEQVFANQLASIEAKC